MSKESAFYKIFSRILSTVLWDVEQLLIEDTG